MNSRFECSKKGNCLKCGGCCRIRDVPILSDEEDLTLRKKIYNKIGILYLYHLNRYTISLSNEEKEILSKLANDKNISLKIIPKKIHIINGEYVIEDWSLDHDICPFYDKKKKQCSIYEVRPIVCKTFPEDYKFNINCKKDENISFDEATESCAKIL